MGTAVLVVDDDDTIRESLVWLLLDEGYTVYEAPDGQPALERLREHPDGMVVLLDVNMPQMDGIAVLQAVEADPPLAARHAFILMSAFHRTLPLAFVQQMTRLNVPMVAKPFDLDRLVATVAAAAERLLPAS
jgi:CheY-like chemotaxis protein